MFLIPLLIFLILLQISAYTQPLAKDKEKFLGAGTSSLVYRDFFKYWNQVTPGNDGKWGSVELVKGQYNWTYLDKIYNYAKNQNILFKEHTFVWGQQQPSWISALDAASQRQAVEDWIRNFCERYPLTAIVDVVNEPLHAQPSYKTALGGDGTTGWDWVITAFELARQYCPVGCILLINEYNVLHSSSATTNYLNIVNLLKDRGLIDGIGIQGHYFEFRSDMNAINQYVYDLNSIKANLNRLAETGLPIYLTEFDIDEPIDSNQLSQYKIYFPIFWSHPAVKGITFWGYIQGDVWNSHPNTYLLLSNGTERSAVQWLRNFVLSPFPPDSLSPNATANVPRNPILSWYLSESADSYRVQISLNNSFLTLVVDTVVVDTFFQTEILSAGTRYYWRVSGINQYGEGYFSSSVYFITGDQIVSVKEAAEVPKNFILNQNFPNPFNPTTKIIWQSPVADWQTLKIFNALGDEVITLVNEYRPAGKYEIKFDAWNLPSGVYFYQLVSGNYVQSKKMILMK